MMFRHCIILLVFAFSFTNVFSQNKSCQGDGFHQFDFWIGHWQVTDQTTGKLAGYNHIESFLDSCAIRENWTGSGNSIGQSINHYDPSTQKWKQKWVDNYGTRLEFEGTIKNDSALFFANTVHPKSKMQTKHRMRIIKIDENKVSQVWDQQVMHGQWNNVFNGLYERTSPIARINEEVNAVYDSFTVAYKTLNLEQLVALYDVEATYLPPRQKILRGLGEISKAFTPMFEDFSQNKGTIEIQFDILDRQLKDDVVIDSGYYYLSTTKPDRPSGRSVGKFLTILKKNKDGEWKFIYDVYNAAPSNTGLK